MVVDGSEIVDARMVSSRARSGWLPGGRWCRSPLLSLLLAGLQFVGGEEKGDGDRVWQQVVVRPLVAAGHHLPHRSEQLRLD